ncbi:MAG TPA: GNAT family N-acetyltransferase [Myxococcota bacterium]|nr:GNAT family N-acetyltransferase [Myxococcota bacterium]
MCAQARTRPAGQTARGRPTIREATLADHPQIAMLVTALGYPTNATDMKERLEGLFADASYTTFAAELGGSVVGMAGACIARFYERNGVYARLCALVVSGDKAGHGVGAALVRAVEKWAMDHGAAEIFLNSGVQREGSHSFYEKLGYRATGVRFSKELG